MYDEKKRKQFFSIIRTTSFKRTFLLRINVHKDRLKDHSSWTPYGIGMLIRGILKSWFWSLLHQGTLFILCSRIQGYLLSLMNEVDPWLLLPLYILYEMQNQIFQQLVSKRSSISCLYNMWLGFRIKENSHFSTMRSRRIFFKNQRT